jgi:ribonuclease HI
LGCQKESNTRRNFSEPSNSLWFYHKLSSRTEPDSNNQQTSIASACSTSGCPWIAPPSSAVKVNVDAAVSKYGNRGVVAAICRDEHGAFLGASVLAVQGIADPATLEAIACREGLALCSDLHVNRIILASDCLEVVNAIKEGSRGSYYSVLCEINQRSSAFASVSFNHEGRKSNMHAHNLARSHISLEHGRHMWLLNSPDIAIVPMMIE